MSDPISPDTGEMLRTFLVAQPEIVDVVADRVSQTLNSDEVSIRYALVWGSNLSGGAVMVTWQVECWGSAADVDDGTAHSLARTVMSLAPDMRGPIAGAQCAGAWADAPRSADDVETGRPRDIVEITFSATP